MIKCLILILLVCCFGQICEASGPLDGGWKGKKCQNSAPDATEGFLFVEAAADPACDQAARVDRKELELFYRWYLRNEQRIRTFASREKHGLRDLLPPLDISWTTVEQYAAYIRKSDPSLDTIQAARPRPLSALSPAVAPGNSSFQPGDQNSFSLKK